MNWLSILIAAVASMLVGAIWYSPMAFGKMWMQLSGKTEMGMKKGGAAQGYFWGFVAALVTAYVLSAFLNPAVGGRGAVETAFWIWLGFVATVKIGDVLWDGKPFKLFVLNSAYQLVSLSVMAVILAKF